MVWSNQPDAALLVELYNDKTDSQVLFRYVSNLTESFTQEAPQADILIGSYINNPSVLEALLPVDELLDALPQRPAEPFLSTARWEGSHRLVPLAFMLPTIVFRADLPADYPGTAITLDQIGHGAAKFGRFGENSPPSRLAFYPPLDPRGVYELLRVQGVSFFAAPDSTPMWDADLAQHAIEEVVDWRRRNNGSAALEASFAARFLHGPPLRLLDNRYLAYLYLPSDELLTWRFFSGGTYDFRWLADNDGNIAVLDSMIWAGIPRTSRNTQGAYDILRWFFESENQLALMQAKADQYVDRFGLFGGFSTVETVNRNVIPTVYPQLSGRVPSLDALVVPKILPRYWDELKAAVLLPFLGRSAEATSSWNEELRQSVTQWYRQRGN